MYNSYTTTLSVDAKFVTDQQLIPVLLPHYRFSLYYQIEGKPRINYTVYASIRVLSAERLNLATPRIRITWYLDFKIYNPLGQVSNKILTPNIFKNATVSDFTYGVIGRTLTQVTINTTTRFMSSSSDNMENGFTCPNDELTSYVLTDPVAPLTLGDQTTTFNSRLSKILAFFKKKRKDTTNADMK